MKKNNIFNNESMNLFFMLCTYFLFVLVLYSVLQIFNIINLTIIQIISIIIPIGLYFILDKKVLIKKRILIIGLYLIILLGLPFVSSKTYDLTVDGNAYHKTAIAFIKNGWNPLYEDAKEFQKTNDKVIKLPDYNNQDLWIEHYPKATWILAANIYNMTNNIESGKCITLIFIIMMIIISYNCLKKILDKKWSFIISLLLAFNPIVLTQIFSYYVDGIMGLMFTIELILLMLLNVKEKIDIKTYISLVSVCSILVNLKFTGLLCSGVIAAIYYFYNLIVNRKDKEFLNIFKRLTILFVIVFSTSIFLVGANSYIRNTIDHKNPLYPIIGKDKVDIITTMQPKSFNNKNDIEKFFISVFSKTENTTYEEEPTLKLPVRVYRSELRQFEAPDVRIGGFGPLFALIFITEIILGLYLLIVMYKKEKQNLKYIILPVLSILISMILIGESWWARYVPQFYLITIGVLILLKRNNTKLTKIISILYLLLILANLSAIGLDKGLEINRFYNIENDIKELKNRNNLYLKATTPDLFGYYYTLKDNNVDFEVIDQADEGTFDFMCEWKIQVLK